MDSRNRKKLDEAVEKLKSLGFKPENIMVTGSLALDIHGVLPYNRQAHDADFFIRMTDAEWRCMQLLDAIYREDSSEYKDNQSLHFTMDGIKLCIWRGYRVETDVRDVETSVYVSPVDSVLAAKRGYGRSKDWKDIADICKNLM